MLACIKGRGRDVWVSALVGGWIAEYTRARSKAFLKKVNVFASATKASFLGAQPEMPPERITELP